MLDLSRMRMLSIGALLSAGNGIVRHRRLLRCQAGIGIDAILHRADSGRPSAFYEREDSGNLFIGQALAEGRHIRFITSRIRSGAILDYPEKKVVIVVPCMAGSVVRRCGHSPVRLALVPIWLAFKSRAMTTCAFQRINPSSRLYPR